LIVHIIRTNRIPFFQSRASPALTLTTLAVMATAAFLPYSPLAGYFGLTPLARLVLALGWWALVTYSVLTHFVKMQFIKRYGVS